MFAVVKTKKIVWFLVIILVVQFGLISYLVFRQFNSNDVALIDFTIVIDAGHGGIDGGVTCNGIKESELNLKYSKCLGNLLSQSGFNVVYTRTNNNGLYGLPTKGFKSRDMQARKKIIQQAMPNMVISIHMNKYLDSARSGAQVFFQQNNDSGLQLAQSIQSSLNTFTNSNYQCLSGDYYVCREVSCPSVIVECGFLSNEREAKQLATTDYKEKLCSVIFDGIMLYLYSQQG